MKKLYCLSVFTPINKAIIIVFIERKSYPITKNYQTFIEHTDSMLTKKSALPNEYFNTYQFSSEYGKGFTAVCELDSYANICIAKYSYTSDFEYFMRNGLYARLWNLQNRSKEWSLDGNSPVSIYYK